MAEQIHNVSDLSKLNDLKFKKKPIVAYFYTEYVFFHIAGVLPVNLSKIFLIRSSKQVKESLF